MNLLAYDPPQKQHTKVDPQLHAVHALNTVVVPGHVAELEKKVLLTLTLWTEPQET